MLSPTEARARNAQVALMLAKKKLEAIENAAADAIKRREKPAVRSTLPRIDPALRPWKRPPNVKRARARSNGSVASAFPMRNEIREYLRGERP